MFIKIINVDKITNALTNFFSKRCKRLLHLWFHVVAFFPLGFCRYQLKGKGKGRTFVLVIAPLREPHRRSAQVWSTAFTGTLKTRDWKTRDHRTGLENAGLENVRPRNRGWKTRDLKSMESATNINAVTMLSLQQRRRRKSTGIKSSGAEIKTVSWGMVAILKSSVHQGKSAPPSCA